ncbi:F-box/FBD/LRR-repeat protein [Camellia lanceoleosa]|uniref:F-box/FBD/LRR-repeat protein n=1 Tax=Camellia lanceoleosa TaxID=1840588 RepID=A0ACC0G5F0_9ERIC|nr:F-box/FBD/LRR-repeat protein [Camellia lanceoleosa]
MDRNSDLPLDVILKILGRSSIEEAVKTSILSGNPIYVKNWSEHTVVVVDSNFWEEHSTRNQLDPGAVAEIVSGILHDHKGPIRKLILCIPQLLVEVVPVIRYDLAQHINKWLFSLLPRNDIEEIILYNYNVETYKIGCLFLLVNLTRLVLRNCIFYQPFGCFGNLHCIRLDNIEFGSDIVGTVTYNFPNLTFFEAVNCSGFRHLKIKAPNLERFNVCATNGDGISMYESSQIGLKPDTKSVKGVDLVYDEGLVYLIEAGPCGLFTSSLLVMVICELQLSGLDYLLFRSGALGWALLCSRERRPKFMGVLSGLSCLVFGVNCLESPA